MNSFKSLLRLLQYAKPHRANIIKASIYSVTNKIFDIAPEILIGMAIDVVVSKEKSFLSQWGFTDPIDQIVFLAVCTFFIWVGESIFEYLFQIKWRGLAQQIQHDLRLDSYTHIQELDLSYFEDKSTGHLVSILNDDVNQLERFLDGGANQILQTATAVIGVGAVFFYVSPLIATVSFLPIPAIILGTFFFQKKAVPLYAKVREKVGSLNALLNNNISGIIAIKSFTSEKREIESVERESLSYLDANKKAIAVSSAFIPIIRMAILAGFLATFTLGAYQVFQGKIAVGSYGVLVFLTQRLLWPLTGLATVVDLFERAMASTNRILDLLSAPYKIQSGSIKFSGHEAAFDFRNVNFSYSSGPQILQDINLQIPSSKTTAFVGSTGSGKSTLIKLLLRFYEPSSGSLTLGGDGLGEFDITSLRSNIGLVSQDVFLFHGTVKENILYGRPDATIDEIKKAARLAEADDFINELPEGYDTIIGERGQKLSGGQRQRISIARAILKNPPILILDEATSAVDNETEAAIQKSLAVITQNRTTIMIAHRLSTIVDADCIHVIDKGRIVESGRHSELVANKGIYNQLWNVQTGSKGNP